MVFPEIPEPAPFDRRLVRRVAFALVPAAALAAGAGLVWAVLPKPPAAPGVDPTDLWLAGVAGAGLVLGVVAGFVVARGLGRLFWAAYGVAAPLALVGALHLAWDAGHEVVSTLARRKVDRCRAEKLQSVCSYREFLDVCMSAAHGAAAAAEQARLDVRLGPGARECTAGGCRLKYGYAGPWGVEVYFPGPITCAISLSGTPEAIDRSYLVYPSTPD